METKKLEPEFKKRWIAALRSGEYKQGTGFLYDEDDDNYCCLGVACAISGRDFRRSNGNYPHHENSSLPKAIRGRNHLTEKLAYMNDGVDQPKKSFLEIADYIEANL